MAMNYEYDIERAEYIIKQNNIVNALLPWFTKPEPEPANLYTDNDYLNDFFPQYQNSLYTEEDYIRDYFPVLLEQPTPNNYFSNLIEIIIN